MASVSLRKDQRNELLFIGFNQDCGCFTCGTDNGFRIYNVDPFKETFRRVFSNGGVGIVEMLFRCNLLALVGGGRNPRYPPNKVMIWDDHQSRCIGELSFRSEVKAVKLRRDRVVVALAQKVYVYRFTDLKLLDQINTTKNDAGLLALCPDATNMVLACPSISRGHVNVELYDIRKSTLIPAHDSELAQIALNMDGSRVATASEKGTLIRVFDTSSGQLVHELRRGMDRAAIYSVAFNAASTFLACSSDRGTVHIFALGAHGGHGGPGGGGGAGGGGTVAGAGGRAMNGAGRAAGAGGAATANGVAQPRAGAQAGRGAGYLNGEGSGSGHGRDGGAGAQAGGPPQNARSGLSFIGQLLPGIPRYFASEWSYAQVRGLDSHSICAFGQEESTVVVVSADGTFRTARFSEPGECEPITYAQFIARPSEEDADDGHAPLGFPAAATSATTLSRHSNGAEAGAIIGGGGIGVSGIRGGAVVVDGSGVAAAAPATVQGVGSGAPAAAAAAPAAVEWGVS